MTRYQSVSTLCRCLKFVVSLVLFLFLVTMSFAQVDRAVLEGTVTDPSGATISNATVKIMAVDTDTGLTQGQRTNSNGYYRFLGLAVGRYSVTVMKTGFKERAIENLLLPVG